MATNVNHSTTKSQLAAELSPSLFPLSSHLLFQLSIFHLLFWFDSNKIYLLFEYIHECSWVFMSAHCANAPCLWVLMIVHDCLLALKNMTIIDLPFLALPCHVFSCLALLALPLSKDCSFVWYDMVLTEMDEGQHLHSTENIFRLG